MAFDVNTITVQGAIAIASATAGNKFVVDGCDATTEILTQSQAVQIATRPASPASTTTNIALAGSTDNHVYAYAEFIQGQSTGGDVHSFYLYGHMENDTSTTIVIAIASAQEPIHIPESGDVANRAEVQFELTFTATTDAVKVADDSMYTTRGEFLILKNRTVTTHAEGTPTTGETQTIYGQKTFNDKTTMNSAVIGTLDGVETTVGGVTVHVVQPPSGQLVYLGLPTNGFSQISVPSIVYGFNQVTAYMASTKGRAGNGSASIESIAAGGSNSSIVKSSVTSTGSEAALISGPATGDPYAKIKASKNNAKAETTSEVRYNDNIVTISGYVRSSPIFFAQTRTPYPCLSAPRIEGHSTPTVSQAFFGVQEADGVSGSDIDDEGGVAGAMVWCEYINHTHEGSIDFVVNAAGNSDTRRMTFNKRGLVTQEIGTGEAILTTEHLAVSDANMLTGANAVQDNQNSIGVAEQVNTMGWNESSLVDDYYLVSSMRVRYGGTYNIPGTVYAQLTVDYAKISGTGTARIFGKVGIKSFEFDGSKFTVEAPVEATNLPDGHIPTPSINASNYCEVAVGGIILLFIETPSTGVSIYNVGDVVAGSACRVGGFIAENNYTMSICDDGNAFPSGYRFKLLSRAQAYDTGAGKYAMALAMRIE